MFANSSTKITSQEIQSLLKAVDEANNCEGSLAGSGQVARCL